MDRILRLKAAALAAGAAEGLSTAEMHARVRAAWGRLAAKQAVLGIPNLGLSKIPGDVLGKIIDMPFKLMGPLGGPLLVGGAVGAPVAAGMAGGHLLAKLRDDDSDVDEAKASELYGEYQRLAEEARRRAALARAPEGRR